MTRLVAVTNPRSSSTRATTPSTGPPPSAAASGASWASPAAGRSSWPRATTTPTSPRPSCARPARPSSTAATVEVGGWVGARRRRPRAAGPVQRGAHARPARERGPARAADGADRPSRPVDAILVHQPHAAAQLMDAPDPPAALVLWGHMHAQVGPTVVTARGRVVDRRHAAGHGGRGEAADAGLVQHPVQPAAGPRRLLLLLLRRGDRAGHRRPGGPPASPTAASSWTAAPRPGASSRCPTRRGAGWPARARRPRPEPSVR